MKKHIKQAAGRLLKDIRQFGLAVVVLLIYMTVVSQIFGAFCPVRLFTGLPCPGCGITRAAVFLMTCRWQQAWQMNPVVFPVVAAALYFAVNRYLLDKEAKGMKWLIAVIAVLLVAVYVGHMIRYFPGREPYSYLPGNILEKMIPAYTNIWR